MSTPTRPFDYDRVDEHSSLVRQARSGTHLELCTMVVQIRLVPSRELPDRMEECTSAGEHRKAKTLLQEVSCTDQAGQDDD